MENNLQFIKTFPNKIKKINLKLLKNNKNLEKINDNKLKTITFNKTKLSKKLLLYKDQNMVFILDSEYNIKNDISFY